MTTDKHQQLIKAPEQSRALEDTQSETKTIEAFSNAIAVARSLNIAVKDFCPSCLRILERELSKEAHAPTIQQSIIKRGPI